MSENSLPSGWAETLLGDLVPKAQYGISVPLGDSHGIPVLRMNNLRDGSVDLSDVTLSSIAEGAGLTLGPNDVLFNGSNSIEHVRRTSLWRGELDVASFASYLVRLVPNRSRLDPEYLVRWLNLADTQLTIRRFATPGVHQVNINPTNLRRSPIAFPQNLAEQCRIAETLSRVDETIEQTEALIAKYQKIKAGLMQDLFTRGVTPDGRLRPTRFEAPHRYKESPLGSIPKEWEATTLSECLHGGPKNGYSPREVDEWSGAYALGLGCLTTEGFMPNQLKMVAGSGLSLESALLADGDLLLSRSNTKALVGLCGVYRDIGAPCIYPDLMMRLRPNGRASSRFIEALLLSPFMRRRLTGAAVGTSGSMVKLNARSVLRLQLAVPVDGEQSRILQAIDQQRAVIDADKGILDKLRQQKLGLMHDLLTGLVRVKVTEPEEVSA